MSEPPTGPWLTWCLEERLFLWPFDLDLRDLRRSGDPSNSVKSPPGRIPSENMTWNNEIEKKNSWIFHNFQKVDQHDGYKSYIYLKTVLEILLWYKKKRLKIKSKKRRRVLGETGLDFILIICEIQLHFFLRESISRKFSRCWFHEKKSICLDECYCGPYNSHQLYSLRRMYQIPTHCGLHHVPA